MQSNKKQMNNVDCLSESQNFTLIFTLKKEQVESMLEKKIRLICGQKS